MQECFGGRTGGEMVAQATRVIGVVSPWVYGVTSVVGEPSEMLA
jgi:hypothetical protein